jgi:hypothetical protein
MADVKVSIVRATDEVAIMTFVTLGRGNVLPPGAEWADKDAGVWMREASAQNVDEEIKRSPFLTVDGPIKGWRIVASGDVPVDRTYRDALRDRGGKLEHDLPAARELHRAMLRHARARAFVELDGEWMKATGSKDDAEAVKVEEKRALLRDVTDDPAIEAAATCEALKATWPDALLGPMKQA